MDIADILDVGRTGSRVDLPCEVTSFDYGLCNRDPGVIVAEDAGIFPVSRRIRGNLAKLRVIPVAALRLNENLALFAIFRDNFVAVVVVGVQEPAAVPAFSGVLNGLKVQAIFTFVSSWNNYFTPALILHDDKKKTLPILIAQLCLVDWLKFDMGQVYVMIAFSIFPVIIVYLILSKHIVPGAAPGSVKGGNIIFLVLRDFLQLSSKILAMVDFSSTSTYNTQHRV